MVNWMEHSWQLHQLHWTSTNGTKWTTVSVALKVVNCQPWQFAQQKERVTHGIKEKKKIMSLSCQQAAPVQKKLNAAHDCNGSTKADSHASWLDKICPKHKRRSKTVVKRFRSAFKTSCSKLDEIHIVGGTMSVVMRTLKTIVQLTMNAVAANTSPKMSLTVANESTEMLCNPQEVHLGKKPHWTAKGDWFAVLSKLLELFLRLQQCFGKKWKLISFCWSSQSFQLEII